MPIGERVACVPDKNKTTVKLQWFFIISFKLLYLSVQRSFSKCENKFR